MPSPFMPRILADTADRLPDKVAFRHGPDAIEYGELAARSNRLANALRANGVRPGELVGILMGKGMENAAAVYGIMAAGAAYVPLDPAAPIDRLERIAVDCRLRHFVVDEDRSTRAATLCGVLGPTVTEPCFVYGVSEIDHGGVVAVSWPEVDTHPASAPAVERGADDPAYLIFTSGSTGTPKGIVHTHGSGSAYAAMAADLYGLTSADRLSNFPPLHFDQSTFDFFSGPLVGATTVIIGKEHQMVPASLSKLIEDERLTIWYSVPLALVQLVRYGVLEERDCSSLRWVIYGGEPFPLKHLDALMRFWPEARYSNCYGPAETNQCTYHHLDRPRRQDLSADLGVPIGVPCPGMETLIVDPDDPDLARLEPGETGELLVHSPTTMRGYLGRRDLDALAFHDRQTPSGTRRYYRTGDLVRTDADGLMQFLGRRDRQIKSRGVRVELDEVEAVLLTHDEVAEVAVTAAGPVDDGGVRPIKAFAALKPEAVVDGAELKRYAGTRLPRPAVPSDVVLVDDFPRTTSGKVDYPALAREGDRS